MIWGIISIVGLFSAVVLYLMMGFVFLCVASEDTQEVFFKIIAFLILVCFMVALVGVAGSVIITIIS